MTDRDRPHLLVDGRVTAEGYSRRAGGDGPRVEPPADRAGHARRLIAALEEAEAQARRRRGRARVAVPNSIPGTYVTFESFPGLELALTSLDPKHANSPSHRNGAGQNVLLLDGSVLWTTSPVYGTAKDNLWMLEGVNEYTGRETRSCDTDAFLVPGFPETDPDATDLTKPQD